MSGYRGIRIAVAFALIINVSLAARKTNRDFASMSDKDWEKIEEEWETPEEKEEYEQGRLQPV